MSAANAVRDLLSTTDALFNKSDSVNAELVRLVRAMQSRRAGAEAGELLRIASGGIDKGSLDVLRGSGGAASSGEASKESLSAAQPSALEKALAHCREASAAMCVLSCAVLRNKIQGVVGGQTLTPPSPISPPPPPFPSPHSPRSDSLYENRDQVVDARAEAISRQETEATASRERLLAELRESTEAVEEKFLKELRDIVKGGSSTQTSTAPAASLDSTEAPQ